MLWPNHLLGGFLARDTSDQAESQTEQQQGLMGHVRNMGQNLRAGRWPDADVVLQSGMSEGLRDWDLWGPLLFCILLSLFLSLRAEASHRSEAFSGVFTLVWAGEAVVTLQIKLLGGNISFFQSVCIIGYTLFPLCIAAVLSAFGCPVVVRIPVYIVLVLWSLAAGVSILGGSGVVKNRVGIAVYPLFIFYVALGCLCLVS